MADSKLEKAVEFYRKEKISLGRATEIADLNYDEMKEELSERGIEIRRGPESVEEFEKWAEEQDADRMRAEVTSQNEKGISFYEDQGLEDYARIMEKEL